MATIWGQSSVQLGDDISLKKIPDCGGDEKQSLQPVISPYPFRVVNGYPINSFSFNWRPEKDNNST